MRKEPATRLLHSVQTLAAEPGGTKFAVGGARLTSSPARRFRRVACPIRANPGILCAKRWRNASSICTSMLTGSLVTNSILPKKVMDPIQLSLSLGEIAVRSHRLMVDFLTRRPELGGLGDPAGIGQAFLQLTAKMIADPMSIAQMQLELWTDHMKLWQRTTERLFDLTGKSDQRPAATDRRFQHPAWTEHVLFNYIKQSYVISAEAILSAVNRVNGLNPKTAHKVDFYTRQFVDAMSPSNFLATNPEVLQTTIETGGENLLRGLTNLLDDLERGRGQLAVTMTDLKAFRLDAFLLFIHRLARTRSTARHAGAATWPPSPIPF